MGDVERTDHTSALVVSLFITQLGLSMTSVGAILLLVDRFGVSTNTAIALAVAVIPNILLGPFVGDLVSRRNPRTIAITSSIVGAALVVLYPFAHSPIAAQAIAFAVGVAVLPGIPSRMALRWVATSGNTQRTSGLIVAAERLALVLGPLAAAAIASAWHYSAIFYCEAVFAVLAAVALLTIPRAHLAVLVDRSHLASAGNAFGRALRLLKSDRLVGEYTFTAVSYSFGVGIRRLALPVVVTVTLHRATADLGILLGALALGGVFGGLLISKIASTLLSRWYVLVVTLESVLWLALVWSKSIVLVIFVLLLIGVCEGAGMAIFFSRIQELVAGPEIGRYFSLISPMTDAAIVLGVMSATALSDTSLATLGVIGIAIITGVPLIACLSLLREARTAGENVGVTHV